MRTTCSCDDPGKEKAIHSNEVVFTTGSCFIVDNSQPTTPTQGAGLLQVNIAWGCDLA